MHDTGFFNVKRGIQTHPFWNFDMPKKYQKHCKSWQSRRNQYKFSTFGPSSQRSFVLCKKDHDEYRQHNFTVTLRIDYRSFKIYELLTKYRNVPMNHFDDLWNIYRVLCMISQVVYIVCIDTFLDFTITDVLLLNMHIL